MNIPHEIERIEKRVREAGLPVAKLLRLAEVDVAQWQRWKKGQQDPRVGTWSKIQRALDDLLSPEKAA